jgi:hypothetical protein
MKVGWGCQSGATAFPCAQTGPQHGQKPWGGLRPRCLAPSQAPGRHLRIGRRSSHTFRARVEKSAARGGSSRPARQGDVVITAPRLSKTVGTCHSELFACGDLGTLESHVVGLGELLACRITVAKEKRSCEFILSQLCKFARAVKLMFTVHEDAQLRALTFAVPTLGHRSARAVGHSSCKRRAVRHQSRSSW